jgi:inorganic triphosphatase YgiF
MSLALLGGGASAAKTTFASAVAVLRSDLEELRRLIDDNSKSALREAAEAVKAHLQDMRELLDEHERFRLESSDDPDFLRLEHDALTLTAELGDAVAEVSLMADWEGERGNAWRRADRPSQPARRRVARA